LSFGAEGGELNYYYFAGPDPKKVIEEYTALVGRSPLPPLWSLGYQQCRYTYYPEARAREVVNLFRKKKIPADVIYFDIDYQQGYAPFTINREYFPHFEQMIADDEFLEHAEVFGNYYGTARRFLREAARKANDLLLDIDVQGAAQIQQRLPQAVSIFVLPPDRKTLESRLRHRSEDAEAVIQRRLVTATREIENYDKYNYILINDRLEESSENLQAIVRSERLPKKDGPRNDEERKIMAVAEPCRLNNIRERVQPILASFVVPAV